MAQDEAVQGRLEPIERQVGGQLRAQLLQELAGKARATGLGAGQEGIQGGQGLHWGQAFTSRQALFLSNRATLF